MNCRNTQRRKEGKWKRRKKWMLHIVKTETVYYSILGADPWNLNSHSWTTECMGPTPPRMPGSWFFLMSDSHSVTAYWITLSTPRRLESVLGQSLRCCKRKRNFKHPMRCLCWLWGVCFYPCLQQSLFSFSSEQFNCARPIRIPAKVPCEPRAR